MELKLMLIDQIEVLDQVNQTLYGQAEPSVIAEIRQNIELIRNLVQDIATLEQRLTIDDAHTLVCKIDVQDAQVNALTQELTEATERLQNLEDTIEINEDQNIIEYILEQIDDEDDED